MLDNPTFEGKPNNKYTVATPENKEKFIAAVLLGVSRKAACHGAGISFSVMTRWFQEARAALQRLDEDENYLPTPTEEIRIAWYMETKEAEAFIEQKAIVHWTSFFDKDWKAAQAFLAIRFRKEWANQKSDLLIDAVQQGVAGNLGGGVSVHVYLPDNGRSAAALEDLNQDIIELTAIPATIEDPPQEPLEEI